MTTAAVRSIREAFPQAEITMLAYPWVADIFRGCPHVDHIFIYDKKPGGKHHGLKGLWHLAKELRREYFDMAILLQNAFEAAVIAKLARIPVRAGYKRDGRSLLLTHGVKIDTAIRKKHQVFYYQGILTGLGLKTGPDELFLQLPEDVNIWAADFLSKNTEGPVVGLNPGAAYGPAKRWPAEKYADLAVILAQELGATMLVFGTDADKEAAKEIASGVPDRVVDLCGTTTLSQAMALIGQCDAFVTNDSGLMHVAAATKTPLVAIFGSTDSIATGPFFDGAVVVQKDMACSPCMKTHCEKNDFACMEEITVEEVFVEVEKLLDL